MAKVHLDRLAKSLNIPVDEVRTHNYQKLITHVINQNSINIANRVTDVSKDTWNKALKKITPKNKTFNLPGVTEVLPKRSVFIRKSAISGKLISETLQDSLTKSLRGVILETKSKGMPAFIIQSGKQKGRIDEKVIAGFEEKIQKTFKNYVKKHPEYGMPTNIRAIAVTEVRSTVNEIKKQYVSKLKEQNPDLEVRKVWIHNPSLSAEARIGHQKVAEQSARHPLLLDQNFQVPRYKKIGGKNRQVGTTPMSHPHDPSAPADQVIGCNCDADYIAGWRK